MTDRDQSIEQLLRQELAADSPLPPDDCPDAEILAALADDTLPAAARREIEGHVVGCHRCQAVTAAIVRADSPADAMPGATADLPTWRRRALNWLVPAAAAATAVALWVLVPGQQAPTSVAPTSEQQIVTTPTPTLPAPSTEAIITEPLRIPDNATANQLARMARMRQESAGVPATGAAAATAAPPPAAAPSPAAPAESALKAEAPIVGGTPAREAASRDQVATPEQRSDAPNETVALQERVAGLQARASFAPDVVSSSDPRVRWRVGPGSVVQRSADNGATWVTQQTGASAALTAGSAPAADVLWIVGRQGLVMRTTDGGRQWQGVPFPERADLAAVTATSTRNATVVATDGRRFATDDGGVTWSPAR
jgi:hypothetical protein